jgi:dolichol-phosphate mannosyltransferase
MAIATGGHVHESAQHGRELILRRRKILMQSGKFLVVGGLGTLVNTATLVILYQQLHLALVAASAVATELAIGHNFVWNDYWTFGRRGLTLNRFARFNVVSLGGQCITILTLWMLVRFGEVHYVAANLVGVGLALIWNFTVNVRWTWGSS